MLQLESLSDFEWRRLVERLDKAVAKAARDYLRHLHASRVPIRPDNWDQELDELRLAREPDYDKPGLPLVYALKYMPRRVISILGSLLAVDIDRYPTGVLDIGSGTGATKGWPTERFCCHDLPEVIKRDDLPLGDMEEVWKRIGSPGSAPPRTWWNPPDDKFLIANPQPSWPLLGESRLAPSGRRQGAMAWRATAPPPTSPAHGLGGQTTARLGGRPGPSSR
ncbi:MAG: hypothetical protein Q8Q00_04995 [Dehalococcoidia bacterium]|nr:hypothetical protein [Dehalococcoidia bacterium]